MKNSKRTEASLTQNILQKREKEFPVALKLQKTTLGFRRLNAEEVYRFCDLQTTAQDKKAKSEPNYDIISQVRAVRAINLGLGIQKPGYNIYVAGVQGTGKTSVIRSFLKKTAERCSTPGDWIYVYNFKNPESPHAMELKTGVAKRFKKQMDELVEQLTVELVDAFQSEEYETNVNSTVNVSNEKKAKLFSELEKTAKVKNFGVKSTRMGIVTVPIIDGKPLSEKDYSELNDEQKEKIEGERNLLEPEVLDFARKVRSIENDTKNKLEELQSELGDYVVSQALIPFLKEYEAQKNVLEYLEDVKKHLLENLNEFLPDEEEGEGEGEEISTPSSYHLKKGDPHLPYRINVFVDNTEIEGAPIIIENNPTFYNLFGKIEKNIEYGVYTTDFKMIKAGSLARANGGYLVLNALDILRAPQVWDTLKRVVKNQKLFIEDLGEQYSILATSGLRPEPIPLNVKIILIGSDWIYRMLYQHDEDFNKIFKIKADFDAQMDRSKKTMEDYVEFISTRTKVENLLPFDDTGIAAIIEFGSRIVDDQDKLTTRFSLIKDITIEADFMAKERKTKKVSRSDVEKAIEERYMRSAAIEDHIIEMLKRKDIIISTSSRRVGEINGLAVYSLGDLSFGVPTRITCRTYKGKPGILNIEREASLSGKLHNKGVSILTSWLNATFARKSPANISATICFEQNYNGVDGDSATLAELCLILSTIANIPIDQGIGVTGSVNQFGEIQPIGGVNEKIEGFFKTCHLQGLNGRQGCIIPVQNVKHLMLNRDVREAIEKNEFHIWPVSRAEEAFELLTGFQAGAWDEKKSHFETGSAFDKIYKTLHQKSDHKDKKTKSAQKKVTKVKANATRKSPSTARKKSNKK
ncbi:Lon protease family protein [Fluviispira multicolorata]|uniref:endopeptidase La n=1 Tax=Fluviispira multicolorata TaxID=2654512 RepID=A0A833JF22_9BACT|nr:ATP-binding protein [Fluviispira multicolorata]KAB8032224.1 AAA family ATPase [Fluviispira multicolorata]